MSDFDHDPSFGDRIARARVQARGNLADQVVRALMHHQLLGGPLPAIGRYKVRRKIGEGGMAVVFEGWDPHLARPVAIKLLNGESSTVDIQHEARVLARLTDPTIVAVYDLGVEADQLYVCMAYVDGGDASRWLNRHRPVAWRRIVGWFADAARGLHVAHRANIVHRDFKLENLLIGSDGLARVTDFGLARLDVHQHDDPAVIAAAAAADVSGEPRSWTGIAGTPGYIAPEVRAGGRADARSDQWSFFIALDRALSYSDDLPPSELAAMIARGTDPDPAARFSDLGAVEVELRELLALPDTGARRPSITTTGLTSRVTPSADTPPPPTPRTPIPARPATGAGQFKGTTIATIRRWCEGQGPNVWADALARLEPADRRAAEASISVSWQPITLYPKLLNAALSTVGEANWEAAFAMGRWAADYELSTIHRLFLRFLSPSTVVERALSLWPRYYDTGVWKIDKRPALVVARLTDWAVVDEIACGQLAGYVARLWELAGHQAEVRHVECRCRGAAVCRFDIATS